MFKTIISLIFVGASIAVFILYVKPTYDATQVKRVQVARFDATLAKTKEIRELKSELLSKFNLFSTEDIKRLEKLLPDQVDNVQLVLDLDGMASKYGIKIKNIDVKTTDSNFSNTEEDNSLTVLNGGSSQDLPYQSLILGFEADATYDQFLLLLLDLESSLRVVDLINLEIKSKEESNSNNNQTSTSLEPTYTFTISLRTYWLK